MKKYVNLFVFVFMVGACFSQGKVRGEKRCVSKFGRSENI